MKSYIGPAQVGPGATLQAYCNTSDERYCRVERTVDAARLRDLAAQNILALFYLTLLYEPADRPYMLVWHQGGGFEEGRFVQGLFRDPVSGDVGLHFSLAKGSTEPEVTVKLSQLLLIEDITGGPVPDYVFEKLRRPTREDEDAILQQAGHRVAALRAKAGRAARPNPYLRHPVSEEIVMPIIHTEFFRFARGGTPLPEPYAVEVGGVVVMQPAEAARAGRDS